MFRRSFLGLGILQAVGTILGIKIFRSKPIPKYKIEILCQIYTPSAHIGRIGYLHHSDPKYILESISVKRDPDPTNIMWIVTRYFRLIES